MNSIITKVFLDEPRLRWPAFRFGFLACIIVIAIVSGMVAAHLPPAFRGRYFGLIIPPMLLLNHLAFQFHWSRSFRVGLRVAAIVWLCFAMVYSFQVTFLK